MKSILHQFTEGMAPGEKVFKLKAPCISNKIRQFAKKAGLDSFHTHTLRHKFAADLLEKGANIKVVQELLGHENLATTKCILLSSIRAYMTPLTCLTSNSQARTIVLIKTREKPSHDHPKSRLKA